MSQNLSDFEEMLILHSANIPWREIPTTMVQHASFVLRAVDDFRDKEPPYRYEFVKNRATMVPEEMIRYGSKYASVRMLLWCFPEASFGTTQSLDEQTDFLSVTFVLPTKGALKRFRMIQTPVNRTGWRGHEVARSDLYDDVFVRGIMPHEEDSKVW